MESLGHKPLPTSMFPSSQTTTEGKRKIDWDNDSDKDYYPPEIEEGLFSSGDDDELHGTEAKKRIVPSKNKQRTMKKKQSRWPVGAMASSLQPVPTTSQLPPSPITDQMQPHAAPDQSQARPTMANKLPRWPAGAMTATSQPSAAISKLSQSPITDQTQPRPAINQPRGPPTVTKKVPRCPVGAMAATSQPSPNSSQLQPPLITNQSQPTTNEPQPVQTTNLLEPPPTVSRKRSRHPAGSMVTGRGRGPSRPHKDWGTGKKLKVVLDKHSNQPIGDTAAILESQLGILARNGNLAPLTYIDWRAPELNLYKERIWQEVKRLDNCPDRVDSDQWRILVAFWGGECAKLAKEKEVETNEVDRIEVFEKTHTNKDGNPVDKDSATAMARLKEGLSQVPESLRSPTFKEQVFTEVLGQDKNGRVCTYGNGPCPSQMFGTRFTRSQELRDREQLREEVRKEVVDEVRKQVVDVVRKEVLAEFGDRFSRLERKCARFEAHAKDIGYPLPPSPEEDSCNRQSRFATSKRSNVVARFFFHKHNYNYLIGDTVAAYQYANIREPCPPLTALFTEYDKGAMEISEEPVIVNSSRLKSVVWNDFDRVKKGETNLQLLFELVTFTRVEADCIEIYQKEKQKVYEVLDKLSGKISLNADMLSANEDSSYFSLTTHFIDDDWQLKKKTLSVIKVNSSHTGDVLSEVIMTNLMDWDIDRKLFSMTCDSSSTNEYIVVRIRDRLSQNRFLLCNGQLFDVRCVANIIKLMVQDVLEALSEVLYNGHAICSPLDSHGHGLACQVGGGSGGIESRDRLTGFGRFLHKTSQSQNTKSDLDKYLEEPLFPRNMDFSILNWWKVHTPRYPILSMMARNILGIPKSKVSIETAFSTGDRMLDQRRSSLRPDTVQALMCAQDWIRNDSEG
ncbi:hypothetical protein Vadar_025779 [Vaccinium darrowii]|uniref:Uncharacterized protein n=1 Tax=Vaccinium darrowii TaxID=229202 RepID=A0ACB7Z6R7_9ERIC|nr:hypothetical protein Vadar_025779 [Vaccinium darrowii]